MVRRRLGLALVLLGALGAFVFPVWFKTYFNVDLGTYRVHDRDGGYRTIADVSLSPAAAPLQITVTGRGRMPDDLEGAATTVTMVLNDDDETVDAQVIRIDGTTSMDSVAPDGEVVIDQSLPLITTLDASRHAFVFGAGDRDDIALAFLDMRLVGNVATSDPRVPIVSSVLLGLGILILAMPLFGRKRGRMPSKMAAPASSSPTPERRQTSNIGRRVPLEREPEKPQTQMPRWGRDGADKSRSDASD